tara:strand:+ start:367 stop:651 length:285 start_codon:yes stop_codon:yes gene_type:complete
VPKLSISIIVIVIVVLGGVYLYFFGGLQQLGQEQEQQKEENLPIPSSADLLPFSEQGRSGILPSLGEVEDIERVNKLIEEQSTRSVGGSVLLSE